MSCRGTLCATFAALPCAVASLLTACGVAQIRPVVVPETGEGRHPLGRIAYATAAFEPVPTTQFSTRGKLHGAGKGFLDGVADCLGPADRHTPGTILLAIISPVCALTSTIAATAAAPPERVVRAADGALRRDMRGLRANEGLRAALAAHVADAGLNIKVLPLEQGPQRVEALPAYGADEADTVLELRAIDLRVVSESKDPVEVREVRLELVTQLRLVRAASGAALDEFTYVHRGDVFILDLDGPNCPRRLANELAGAQRAVIQALAARWPGVLLPAEPGTSAQVARQHIGQTGDDLLGLVLGGAAEAGVEGL